MEAMTCGRPVLATRSGGMPEYLEGSQGGPFWWSGREHRRPAGVEHPHAAVRHPALCAEMGAAEPSGHRIFCCTLL